MSSKHWLISAAEKIPGVDQVADDLEGLDEIRWAVVTTGSYDVFAWANLPSAEDLGIFLRTKVGVIPGVRRMEAFLDLSDRKRGYSDVT